MALSPSHSLGGATAAILPSSAKPGRASELDVTPPAMDGLGEELARLAAVNAELVAQLRAGAAAKPAHSDASQKGADTDSAEPEVLRQENAELRARVAELESLLAAASQDAWLDQQREYEALLEEKSEVIRSLHLKLQELQEGARRAPNEPVPKEEELRQLKMEMEEQRQQLQHDEESLMTQMRQMELALSKDRAELARQRQEVQRVQTELNREVEQSIRDTGLRERLMNLRRSHDGANKDSQSASASSSGENGVVKKNSGLFRRLFG
jgi:hypothetical protein